MTIECISAVTLATRDMARAVRFYQDLGFTMRYGGETAPFTSFSVGPGYLNLLAEAGDAEPVFWGRVILYVSDVDAMHELAISARLRPLGVPEDGSWGERYFHIRDPDGHELSFAKRL